MRSSITLTPADKSTFSRFRQSKNICRATRFIYGKRTSFKFLQCVKAPYIRDLSHLLATLSGIYSFSRDSQCLKAQFSIFFTVSGIIISRILVCPSKALSAIFSTPSGISTTSTPSKLPSTGRPSLNSINAIYISPFQQTMFTYKSWEIG